MSTTPNAPTAREVAPPLTAEEQTHAALVAKNALISALERKAAALESLTDELRAALLTARREVRALRDAAKDCADELEAEVRNRYHYPDVHPAMQHKYERDMESVETARAALAATQEEK